MTDTRTIMPGADGLECAGQRWRASGPWLGLALTDDLEIWRAMLAAAAAAREATLELPRLAGAAGDPGQALALLADLAAGDRPRGLIVSADWQAGAAALCEELGGGALDLGLADAVRIDEDGRWRGHHLLAGALEAVIAQTWPSDAAPASRATVLGHGPDAAAAVLAVVRRGTGTVRVIVPDGDAEAWLSGCLAAGSDVLTSADIEVATTAGAATDPSGLYVRVAGAAPPRDPWLPDAAGDEPALLLDLARAERPPLGFLVAPADLVRVVAAGLASAWYLGLPVPWDALREAAGV